MQDLISNNSFKPTKSLQEEILKLSRGKTVTEAQIKAIILKKNMHGESEYIQDLKDNL